MAAKPSASYFDHFAACGVAAPDATPQAAKAGLDFISLRDYLLPTDCTISSLSRQGHTMKAMDRFLTFPLRCAAVVLGIVCCGLLSLAQEVKTSRRLVGDVIV